MVAFHTCWYNCVRIHKTLRVAPGMTASLTDRLWGTGDVVALIEAREALTAKRGTYRPRQPKAA